MSDTLNLKSIKVIYIMQSKSRKMVTPKIDKVITQLGLNIKIARVKRNWTMDEFGLRCGVSRQTIARVESGDITVSFGIYVRAINMLGMLSQLEDLCSPERDIKGNTLVEVTLLGGRVRKNKKT